MAIFFYIVLNSYNGMFLYFYILIVLMQDKWGQHAS